MKLITGSTPRSTLIAHAVTRVRVYGYSSEWAVESVLDGAKPGTLGEVMKAYYEGISDVAAFRLFATIRRLANDKS